MSIKKICPWCKKEFLASRHERKHCSRTCAASNQMSNSPMLGDKNPRWKGGRIVKEYIFLLKPNHPNANSIGYIREHRYIMSNFLKRPLKSDEDVHHINGNKHDNRIENLKLLKKGEHSIVTILSRKRKSISGEQGVKQLSKVKFEARIVVNKKTIYLGVFKTKKAAADAYKFAKNKYFGTLIKESKISSIHSGLV